jgi:two-component system cell cycle sensor histidine kinase/response regulator CckA
MTIKTARVPAALEDVFARAEEAVAGYFRDRRDDPEHGTIEVFGERYVLVRAASLSVEFFALVRELLGSGRTAEADEFSRNILYDLAHAIGRSDARRLHSRMNLVDPVARLAAGPTHFAHTGWAFVDIDPRSHPVPSDEYLLVFDHPYSFEADAWLEHHERPDFPVCIMGAGYASGWCQESFDVRLVAAEVLCRARGDEACRFVMAPPSRIEARVEEWQEERPPDGARRRSYQIPNFFARKRIEEELRRARDELERRVAERTADLEQANQRLQDEIRVREQVEDELLRSARLEAVGRLAGGIAHDFNNLMGVVIGQASMLEHTVPEGSPLIAVAREIRTTGQQAAQLTQQLLSLSRAQIHNREPVDLSTAVRSTLELLERLLAENIRLRTDLAPNAGVVRIDRGQLTQVVMNLVLNARDAMPDGGALTIRTAPAGGRADEAASWAVLEVSDTGAGMDERTAARAFEPFFSTKPAGTGLGLPTVQRIVAGVGGSVALDSAPGVGTTFRVRLRCVVPEASGVEAAEAGVPRGRETILVVEDQPSLRAMIARMLEALGYVVRVASDPAAALQDAASGAPPIDLLLSDVVLPQMNGRQLADRLRAGRPGLKVLFISGYPDDDVLRHGVEGGRMELLAKPFTADQLARRVRGVLDG